MASKKVLKEAQLVASIGGRAANKRKLDLFLPMLRALELQEEKKAKQNVGKKDINDRLVRHYEVMIVLQLEAAYGEMPRPLRCALLGLLLKKMNKDIKLFA